MITPFSVKAKVDLDAVSVLVDFYLQAGVKGFFANCLSSEMFSISEDERLELTSHIVKYVNGRVPVVATGSFGLAIEDKATFTRQIYDTGIEAVIMITGHFARLGEPDEVLLKNFETIFNLTENIPLGLYECPAPYKRIISPQVFRQLLDTNRLVYHKDTSILPENVKAKLDMIYEYDTIEFYDAHTPNSVFSLQNGAKGMSAIAGNFYPEIMVWMCNNALNPDKQELLNWLQAELTAVDPLIHIAYPMSAKYFLEKRGLPVKQISRSHIMQLTPEQKQTLDEIYNRFLGWCEKINISPVTI